MLRANLFFKRSQPSMKNWRKVWYVTFAILAAETLFYLLFASGEEQAWNKAYEDDQACPESQTEDIVDEKPLHKD
jgi:hypothetical protein